MATENYIAGHGGCKTCGQPLMSVGSNNSGESSIYCLHCAGKVNSTKPGLSTDDPGEAEMRKMLALSGVHIPVSKDTGGQMKLMAKSAINPRVDIQPESRIVTLSDIVQWLEAQPMPKDIKQFKAINKAINILKKVLAESDNGN